MLQYFTNLLPYTYIPIRGDYTYNYMVRLNISLGFLWSNNNLLVS